MDSLNRKCDDKTCKLKEVKVISSFSILFRDQWTAMRCIFASMFKECCKGYFCAHLHSGLRSFALICAHERILSLGANERNHLCSFALICAHLRSTCAHLRSERKWAQNDDIALMSAHCAHERKWAHNFSNYFSERKWAQNGQLFEWAQMSANIIVSANEHKNLEIALICANLRSFRSLKILG